MPKVRKRSGWRSGSSTTSRNFSKASRAPPTSSYVTSGLSSTVINDTVGSIFGGKGIWMAYLVRSTPTRMPSSTSVGATFSPRPTTNLAICFTLITYLQFSSSPSSMILVHLATCSGCSSCNICLSETRSHIEGAQRPVSESLMPIRSFTFCTAFLMSSSTFFSARVYGPLPYVLSSSMSPASSSSGVSTSSLGSYSFLLAVWHSPAASGIPTALPGGGEAQRPSDDGAACVGFKTSQKAKAV
mmetsp:Transcript_15867/g.55383  ORF Transcript_15867/g.55383 Transcript_15867/m.55383 type:complete len:243 (+) Transcript_15867:817-1545(+)